jgi:biopolymer transport protein ExbD
MRCPRCNEVTDVKPTPPPARKELQQARELPDAVTEEPEAPPVMRPPLAQPAKPPGPPQSPAGVMSEANKPPDARLPKRAKRVPQESEMDMTPMVDCVFQLLIFFMLTASFAVQKSLLMPKPTVDEPGTEVEPKDENLDSVTVRIDAQNSYFVSGGGLGEDEVEAPSTGELIMKLKQARQPAADGRIPNKLMVVANGEALHKRVVAAIDAGNDVGMEEVGLQTGEDTDQ